MRRPKECRGCSSICSPYLGPLCRENGGNRIPKNRRLVDVDIRPGQVVASGEYIVGYGVQLHIEGDW